MSSINLKSITGITSITTPAGVDNVFTVHTNDTVERFRIDQSGNQRIAGILTVTQNLDVDGHTNLDNVSIAGVTTFSGGVGAITVGSNSDLRFVNGSNYGTEAPKLTLNNNSLYLQGGSSGIVIRTLAGNNRFWFNGDHFQPVVDSTSDLGTNTTRFRNVYADTLYGDGSNLTGITGVTINNNTNNNLVTATGTTGTLNGESLLTFDGNVLLVASNSYNILEMRADENNDGGNDDNILKFTHDGTFRAEMRYDESSSTLELSTSDNGGHLVIDSSGRILLGTAAVGRAGADELTIGNGSGDIGLSIRSGTSNEGNIYFSDSTSSGNGENRGIIRFDHSDDSMQFFTASGNNFSLERLRIGDDGQTTITAASGDSILHIKRSNTNTTGLTGGINFVASDDHSVANIQAIGDGDNEGAHILFKTTSAAAGDIFNAATVERLRIASDGKVHIGDAIASSGTGALNIKTSSAGTYLKFRSASDFDSSLEGTALDSRNSANNASKDLVVRSQTLVFWQGSNEKLRFTHLGQIGISGANYGTSGQVLTSTGSSSGVSWSTITGTTINSNADNRVITGSGTANTLNGESNLTFDGNTLFVSGQIVPASDGNKSTQGGVALVVRHSTNSALRANHFLHDDFPSGSGTYFIQATEAGVSNDRNLCLQGYGGKVKIGATTEPTETLDVNGNVKASHINLANSIFHTGDTDTKIVFTDNQIDLQTGGNSRFYATNSALYVRSGFPLAFLATGGGATPHIKSGGTNNQDLLFTTGSGNPTRLRIREETNGRYLGRTPLNPAESALEVKNDVSGTPDNGWYYIKQFGNVARLHYCVFKDKDGSDIAGGPWTINWIAGVDPSFFDNNGSTSIGRYLNLCKGIGIDKPGRGMESSRTSTQVHGAWLAVKRAIWEVDPGMFTGASASEGGGVLIMPIMNINGEGGSSDHRTVYDTSNGTHIPANQNGDRCNANQLFCGWWGGNDFSSWATDNNSVPGPEDWGPGDSRHNGTIGAKSHATAEKPSWKDKMLVTCIYK